MTKLTALGGGTIEKLSYTIIEAALATSISRASLEREIASGALVARKRGSRTLILAEDLRAYLKCLPMVVDGGS